MHPQFYRLVLAFRKADIKVPLVKTLVAETVTRVATMNSNKEVQEALLAALLAKELMDALQYSKFDVSRASGANLVAPEETYDKVDHLLAVCCNVASTSAAVMHELTAAFTTPDHWGVWMVLQGIEADNLKAACELYVPSAKGTIGTAGWRQQLEHMGRINPPVLSKHAD